MATQQVNRLIQNLRQAAHDFGDLTDGRLLERFVKEQDETAFEALVRRHGAMVLGICRRVLNNSHDAEDAFQATFLILVRKAASLGRHDTLGNWLYGVAYHAALKSRAATWKRATKESQVRTMANLDPDRDAWLDLQPLLDQELSRLPDKYREPVVLCELEGRSRKEVAQQLGIPEGTLSSRLATARRMLARRLARHGLALTCAAWSASAAAAAVPPALLNSTVQAAAALATGQAVAAPVAAIMTGVLRHAFLTKLKLIMALFLTMAAGTAVAVRLADRPAADAAPKADVANRPPALPVGRLTPSTGIFGDLDRAFSGDGKVIIDNNAVGSAVLIDDDGKIVVAGKALVDGNGWDFSVTRLNRDGSLDTTFGVGGVVTTSLGDYYDVPTSLAIDRDGKIVVAGWTASSPSRFAVVRYQRDGSLDTTFDGDGIVTTSLGLECKGAGSMALAGDGRIVVVGTTGYGGPWAQQVGVIRYNRDGSLDTSFSDDGWLIADFGHSSADHAGDVVIDGNGKIVIVGGNYHAFVVTRYNLDGTLDTTLDGDGLVTTANGSAGMDAYSVVVDGDGKLIVGGYLRIGDQPYSHDFVLARYHPDGALDTTFGSAGIVTTSVGSPSKYALRLALDRHGKIILAGDVSRTDFTVLRYHPDGRLDTTFAGDGRFDTDFGGVVPRTTQADEWAAALAVDVDGGIVVTGATRQGPYDLAIIRIGNNAPTNVELSQASILAGSPVGTPVGTLMATDSDAHNTFTYRLVEGEGGTDNALFTIVGDVLTTKNVLKKRQLSCSVRVRVTDQGGLSFEKALTLMVRRTLE